MFLGRLAKLAAVATQLWPCGASFNSNAPSQSARSWLVSRFASGGKVKERIFDFGLFLDTLGRRKIENESEILKAAR
jgi:hypothetical protein